jgi:hypothetical protein
MRNHKNIQAELNIELTIELTNERKLNEAFYKRMSGEIPWAPGERAQYEQYFAGYSERIKALQGEDAACEVR